MFLKGNVVYKLFFAYSWQLLDPQEQKMLTQLSLFRGGFSRQAALQVTGGDFLSLVGLVQKSLIQQVNQGRYNTHMLLRQFAAEKLEDHAFGLFQTSEFSSEHDPKSFVTKKYSHYYLNFLAERELPLAGKTPQVPAAEITTDLENIRQGWDIAVKNRDGNLLLRALNAFADFLQLRSRYREAERVFGEAANQLANRPELTETIGITIIRLNIHKTAALVRLARYDEAITLAQAMLLKAQNIDDFWAQGYTHLHWGEALWRQQDYPQAQIHLQASLNMAHEHNLERLQGSCNFHLNIVYYFLGKYEIAQKYVTTALEIWHKLDNTKQKSYSLNSLGLIYYRLGEIEKSQDAFNSTIASAKLTGDFQAQVSALSNLSIIATDHEDYANAKEYLEQCLMITQTTGDKSSEANAQFNLGWNAFKTNQFDQAAHRFQKSLRIYKDINNTRGESLVFKALGDLAAEECNFEEAQAFYQSALAIAEKIGDTTVVDDVEKSKTHYFTEHA